MHRERYVHPLDVAVPAEEASLLWGKIMFPWPQVLIDLCQFLRNDMQLVTTHNYRPQGDQRGTWKK